MALAFVLALANPPWARPMPARFIILLRVLLPGMLSGAEVAHQASFGYRPRKLPLRVLPKTPKRANTTPGIRQNVKRAYPIRYLFAKMPVLRVLSVLGPKVSF